MGDVIDLNKKIRERRDKKLGEGATCSIGELMEDFDGLITSTEAIINPLLHNPAEEIRAIQKDWEKENE